MSFVDFVLNADLRFLQERAVGLDLYRSGYAGIVTFCLAVSSATVFLLAKFHVIPSRKHTSGILLGLGVLSALAGLTTSYLNYSSLPSAAASLISNSGGPLPVDPEQTAAVVSLPLYCGVLTLCFDLVALLYLALFWGAGVAPNNGSRKGKKKRR